MVSSISSAVSIASSREYYDPGQLEPCPLRESVTLALLSWVPRGLGERLRRLFYRSLFARADNSFRIFPGVELLGARSIFLGSHVVIRSQVSIEANSPKSQVRVGDRTVLDRGIDIRVVPGFSGCHIDIGADTYIGPYSCLAGPGNVTIGNHCMVAGHTSIYANNHIFADSRQLIDQQGITRKGIVIGDDCWLGTGVKVCDGVTIGRGCVIGAGAVVTKDLPEYSVAVGVPARVVNQRS